MTTHNIEDVIIRTMMDRQFPIFLTKYAGRGFQEADVLGINKNGYIYEYEIKQSRSDFFADFKNKPFKHRKLSERKAIDTYDEWKNGKKTGNKIELITIPNRYYIVCEEGLIKKEEVPEYAGLIYVYSSLDEIKPAKLLHKNKANALFYERVATIFSQRVIYGCSYYTYLQRIKNEQSK